MAETIRINPSDHSTLKQLAADSGRNMNDLFSEAVVDLKRKFMLEATVNGYHALRRDTDAWRAELDERSAWDTAQVSEADDEDWQ